MKFSIPVLICATAFSVCPILTAQQQKASAPQYHPVFKSNLDPEKFENKDAVTPLIQKREAVIRKMLAERSKILKNDRRAKELHEKILNLNKELAVLMENKRAIRDLTRELQQIDKQINAMPLKKKNQITTKQGNKK